MIYRTLSFQGSCAACRQEPHIIKRRRRTCMAFFSLPDICSSKTLKHCVSCCRFMATDMSATERKAQLRIDVPLEIGEIYPAKRLWRSIMEAPMNGLLPFENGMTYQDKIPNAKMGSYAILFLVDLATCSISIPAFEGKSMVESRRSLFTAASRTDPWWRTHKMSRSNTECRQPLSSTDV